VEEHRFNHNHVVKFQGTRILSIVPGYIVRLTRGRGDWLEVHPNNMNREEGWPDVERVMETSFVSLKKADDPLPRDYLTALLGTPISILLPQAVPFP
jgi:hypothetical protein